jgi:hypothetical protein
MSQTQRRIIERLFDKASASKQNYKHAAALCMGKKIISMRINTHRSKFGNEIKCSGHSEIACMHHLFPTYFRTAKLRGKQYV